jgi:hypothetical protein
MPDEQINTICIFSKCAGQFHLSPQSSVYAAKLFALWKTFVSVHDQPVGKFVLGAVQFKDYSHLITHPHILEFFMSYHFLNGGSVSLYLGCWILWLSITMMLLEMPLLSALLCQAFSSQNKGLHSFSFF